MIAYATNKMGVAELLTITTISARKTLQLGEQLGKLLESGDILTLDGELGAGKTCFAKGVAVGLEIKEHVTSPTFTLINEYSGRLSLYHMDVYRLGSSEEFEDLGYEDYVYGSGVTLIEWSSRVEEYLPERRLDIKIIKHQDSTESRIFKLIPYGERYVYLLEELKQIVRAGN